MIEYGYRLYDGLDGRLHFDQIVAGRIYPLRPETSDEQLPRGYYTPDFTYLGDHQGAEALRVADDADIDYPVADVDYRDWEEFKHRRGQPGNAGQFGPGGGGSASKGAAAKPSGGSYGQSYVRAGETGEKTGETGKEEPSATAEAAKKLTGKVLGGAKEFVAADYEIIAELFKSKAKSKERGKMGRGLRQMGKALGHLAKAHVKEEIKHAKNAAGGLKTMLTGKRPSPDQVKGIRSFATRALLSTAGMAVGDPTGALAHGAAAFVSHFGQEVVQHVVIEHALKLFGGGGMAMVQGAVAQEERDAEPDAPDRGETGRDDDDTAGDTDEEEDGELSEEEIALLQGFLNSLAEAVEDMTEEDAHRIILQGQDDDGEDEELDDGEDVDYSAHDDIGWRDDFVESEHPRGQPENAGQFTSGAGGGGAQAKPAKKTRTTTKRIPLAGGQPNASSLATPAEPEEKQVPRTSHEPHAVSTRVPSEPQQRKAGIKVHETAQHLVDRDAMMKPEVAPWLKKVTDLLTGREAYGTGKLDEEGNRIVARPYAGMPPVENELAHQAMERFIDFAKGNILAIYHSIPEEWRDRASLWYDGAYSMTDEWSKTYGYSQQQMAGVIAAQSPKKDWFQNVEVAKRMVEYTRNGGHLEFNQKAADQLQAFIDGKIAGEAKKRAKDIAKGRAPDTDLDSVKYARMLRKFRKADGSWIKLGELTDPLERAAWMSMYDKANGDPHYRELTPEGKYGDYVTNKDQEAIEPTEASEGKRAKKGKPAKPGDRTVLVWQTMDNIAKGLEMLDNGSTDNISAHLGDAHKVRNFYMNIMYPNSEGGHITADTHAIAGALLKPLGQTDPEVMVGLGNGGPKNATHGLKGSYPLIAEAYRQAAASVHPPLKARQMQSIVWEGLRGLFSPEAKRDPKLRNNVDAVWHKHMRGEISADQAREDILKLASPALHGAPRTPKWHGVKM